MMTDPPYGVQAIGGNRDPRDKRNHRSGNSIENDDLTGEGLRKFLESAWTAWAAHLTSGASWYCFFSDTETLPVLQSLDTLGSAKHVLVWVKEQFVFGRSDYHYRHEPIAYGWTKGAAHTWLGSRDQSTIWEVPRDAVKKMMHPTVKPVELFSRAFNNHTVKGDLVVEPFSGSGSQLCAAQQAGRICYAMDNEPKYVAVALERLNQMGLEPKLLE